MEIAVWDRKTEAVLSMFMVDALVPWSSFIYPSRLNEILLILSRVLYYLSMYNTRTNTGGVGYHL